MSTLLSWITLMNLAKNTIANASNTIINVEKQKLLNKKLSPQELQNATREIENKYGYKLNPDPVRDAMVDAGQLDPNAGVEVTDEDLKKKKQKLRQILQDKENAEIRANNKKWEAAMSGVLNTAQGVGNYFAAKAWDKKWKKKFADMQDYSTTVGDTADIRLMAMNAANQYDPHSPTGALATAGLYSLVNQQFGGKQDIDMTPSFINAMAGIPAGIVSMSNWLAYLNSLKLERVKQKSNKNTPLENYTTIDLKEATDPTKLINLTSIDSPSPFSNYSDPQDITYKENNPFSVSMFLPEEDPNNPTQSPDVVRHSNSAVNYWTTNTPVSQWNSKPINWWNSTVEYNPPIPQNRQGGTLKLIPRK